MAARRKRTFNRSRWELERERFGIINPEPPLEEHIVKAGDVVTDVVKKMGLGDRLWEQQLLDQWADLVGPAVARHAQPGRIERKILHVYIDSSAWLNELKRYGERQMLDNLQARFGRGRIAGLRLQLNPDAAWGR